MASLSIFQFVFIHFSVLNKFQSKKINGIASIRLVCNTNKSKGMREKKWLISVDFIGSFTIEITQNYYLTFFDWLSMPRYCKLTVGKKKSYSSDKETSWKLKQIRRKVFFFITELFSAFCKLLRHRKFALLTITLYVAHTLRILLFGSRAPRGTHWTTKDIIRMCFLLVE